MINDNIYELIKKAQKGDKTAIETIVEDNSGLIWSIVRKFSNRGIESDDLYQIGAIGIIKCIKKFDVSYEVKFSTYAVPMIMGEIRRFLRDDGMIKISRPIKELAIKSKYAEEKFSKEYGRSPTIKELAEKLNVTTENLIVALESNRDVESLYGTVYKGDGAPVLLMDKIPDKNNKENNLVDKITLREIINNLDEKEQQVIKLRYFNDKTQSEVAKIIGVSQVQVSRIEKKVLKRMREDFLALV